MSRNIGRDAELARQLGLSWADGDRIVIITRYGGDPRSTYWSLDMRVAGGAVMCRSGATRDSRGKVATMLRGLVTAIRAKYGEPERREARHVA